VKDISLYPVSDSVSDIENMWVILVDNGGGKPHKCMVLRGFIFSVFFVISRSGVQVPLPAPYKSPGFERVQGFLFTPLKTFISYLKFTILIFSIDSIN